AYDTNIGRKTDRIVGNKSRQPTTLTLEDLRQSERHAKTKFILHQSSDLCITLSSVGIPTPQLATSPRQHTTSTLAACTSSKLLGETYLLISRHQAENLRGNTSTCVVRDIAIVPT